MEVEENKKTKTKKQSSVDIIKGVRNFQTTKNIKQSMRGKIEILKSFLSNTKKILTSSNNYIDYKSNSGRSKTLPVKQYLSELNHT